MEQPKFVITSTNRLRMGMAKMHKDLLQPGEDCYGGGYYEFDFVGNRLILTGRSYDYGKPKWHWLDTLKVSSVYRGSRIVYVPSESWEDDFVVSEEISVEYVDE